MRPNQQNKNRSRGRNNGRKNVNPLSRNFESNGPDVKIRGNASHIAERYLQLARDAQASGDSVMAENYLQHAEHYFRIISAAQAQQQPRNDQSQDSDEDSDDNEMDAGGNNRSNRTDNGSNRGSGGRRNQDENDQRDGEQSDSEQAAASDDEGDADENREKKPRRPRRRRVSESAKAEAGADPSGAPQPDVGELPAFLTGGSGAAAAE